MRRIQVDISQRRDGRWDVEVARWQIHPGVGGDRDEVITGREGLADEACLTYLADLVRTGILRRDSHAMISDVRGSSSGPTPRVGELLNRDRPLSAVQR